jgi:hypothetical protein
VKRLDLAVIKIRLITLFGLVYFVNHLSTIVLVTLCVGDANNETKQYLQAMLMKDVVLSPDHPKELLLQKHADYIASYGVNKDEYVSNVE